MPRKAKSSKGSRASQALGCVRKSFNSMPCPDEERVTIRYTDIHDVSATVGSYSYLYGLNDVYDPDITGTGGQPAYYDQWTGLYNRWVVSELEYDVAITSRTVSGHLSVAVAPVTATSLVPASFEAASSLRMGKHAETTGGGPTYHIKGKVPVSKLFGVPEFQVEADDSFQGAVSASPSRRAVLAVVCETSGATDALSLTVVLKWKVRFYQPIVAALSLRSYPPAASAAEPTVGCTFTRTGVPPHQVPRPVEGPMVIIDEVEVSSTAPRIVDHGGKLCTCGCMRHF